MIRLALLARRARACAGGQVLRARDRGQPGHDWRGDCAGSARRSACRGHGSRRKGVHVDDLSVPRGAPRPSRRPAFRREHARGQPRPSARRRRGSRGRCPTMSPTACCARRPPSATSGLRYAEVARETAPLLGTRGSPSPQQHLVELIPRRLDQLPPLRREAGRSCLPSGARDGLLLADRRLFIITRLV